MSLQTANCFLDLSYLEQRVLLLSRRFVLGTQGDVLGEVCLENGNLFICLVDPGFQFPALMVG